MGRVQKRMMRRTQLRRSPWRKRPKKSRVTKDFRVILEGRDYAELRLRVFDRDQGICQICKKAVSWQEFEMDHWIGADGQPLLSRGLGGSKRHDSLETCRTTHRVCNRNRVVNERR